MSTFKQLLLILVNLLVLSRALKAAEASTDLSPINLQEQINLNLEGPWDIYWNKLISEPFPSQTADGQMRGGQGWKGLRIASGEALPSKGFATFRLRIKGIYPADRLYTLKIPAMEGGMRFYLYEGDQGKLIGSAAAGQISNATTQSSKRDQFLSFVAKPGQEYVLLLQLANISDARGGFMDMIVLWQDDLIIRQQELDGLLNAMCFGVCIASGISMILMWVRRRSDKASFYLFLVSMAGAGRILTTNQSIVRFVDDSFFTLLKSGEYASMALSLYFVQFIHYAFPQVSISKRLIQTFNIMNLVLVLIPIIFPSIIFTAMLTTYQLVILCGALLVLYIISRAMWMRLQGAYLAATGCIVVIGAVAFDIILVNRLKLFSFFASSIGVAVYMSLQAQLVAIRSAMTYKLAERLAKENETTQKALRIETETRFGLATAVAHRLNNPLNYIQMGLNDIRGLTELLRARINTLLGPSQEDDSELAEVRSSFENIFTELETPFSHAQKGLQKASNSITEIRTLSGIDGLSVEPIALGQLMQQVAERMTEQIDGTSYRRLSFHCAHDTALLSTNLYLAKNVIEVFIGHSLQLSEGPLTVSAEADRRQPSWSIRLVGRLSEDADEWTVLEERLSFVLRPIGAKLSIHSEGAERILSLGEPSLYKAGTQFTEEIQAAS